MLKNSVAIVVISGVFGLFFLRKKHDIPVIFAYSFRKWTKCIAASDLPLILRFCPFILWFFDEGRCYEACTDNARVVQIILLARSMYSTSWHSFLTAKATWPSWALVALFASGAAISATRPAPLPMLSGPTGLSPM